MNVKSALQISDRLMAWNMPENAAAVLESCLERHPHDPLLLRRLARVRMAQGRPREAAALLRQALAHLRLSAPLRASLGRPTGRRVS